MKANHGNSRTIILTFESQSRHEARRKLSPKLVERNCSILKHIGLAYTVALRQTRRSQDDFDDILQESTIGLTQGVEHFDSSRGHRPSSYLISRATGQVLHYRRDRARIIRIPWRLRDLFVKGQRLQEERRRSQLQPLSDLELARALNVSTQRWHQAVASQRHEKVCSLESNHDHHLGIAHPDQQLNWIRDALSKLHPFNREIVVAHLIDGEKLRNLATRYKMSPRHLSNILHLTLATLQNWAKLDGLLVRPS